MELCVNLNDGASHPVSRQVVDLGNLTLKMQNTFALSRQSNIW
jgi:hypothetical protein